MQGQGSVPGANPGTAPKLLPKAGETPRPISGTFTPTASPVELFVKTGAFLSDSSAAFGFISLPLYHFFPMLK